MASSLLRRLLSLAAAAAVLVPLAAAAQGNPPRTLRIGMGSGDPDALDPTLSRTYTGRIVFNGLCDKLVDIDEKLGIHPQLAESYTWTSPTELVFKLRPGMVFHDGTPIDAESVKFNMERHATMQGSTRRAEIAGLERVVVVDPLTVRMELKAPNAPFLAQLTDRAGMLVSPTAAKALGADFAKSPVCSGPFRFTERVPQDRIVLDRFDRYYDKDRIHLDRVIYLPIVDGSVLVANLRAGAIEFGTGYTPNNVGDLRRDNRLNLFVFDGLGYVNIGINHNNGTRPRTPLMTDARVRKAFELSIDRKALVDVVFDGLYVPIAQAVPPNSPFYAPEVPPLGRDVARARALLAEAGVRTPLVVELMVLNSPDARQTGEVIQSMAAEAGFDVRLRSQEIVSALRASDQGEHEAFMIGWSGRIDADGNLASMVTTNGPLNAAKYSNPDVDRLIQQAREVTDVAARRAIYGQVAVQLQKDLPSIYLYSARWIFAANRNVTGFRPVPDGLVRLQDLKLAPSR